MFTGIIEAVGSVNRIESIAGDLRVHIDAGNLDLRDVALGDSIACNGVCLTVVELSPTGFVADVSRETISVTTVQHWQTGFALNLEKALLASARFGGHIVSGHVDGIGSVRGRKTEARSERLAVEVPAALSKYIAHKGSVCIDGVSLTVNQVTAAVFSVNIVPHTLGHTVIEHYREGTAVNIEVDVIARYVERLQTSQAQATPLSKGFLQQHGFC